MSVKVSIAIAAVSAVVSISSPAASAQWVNTATQGTNLVSATDLGAVTGVKSITVRVGLAIQNKPALLNFVKEVNDPSSSIYGQYLTPAQFKAEYSPTAAQVNQVTTYLQSKGLTGITVEPNNLLISATGNPVDVAAAFNTTIHQFNVGGKTFYANINHVQVPLALNHLVVAVLGLNDASYMQLSPIQRSAYTPASPGISIPNYPASYEPGQFWWAYDAEHVAAASNATIAIFAEGDLTQVVKDLRLEETAYKVKWVPYQIMPVGIPSPDTSGADEWDLDTQYSSGMAKAVKELYIYDTTSLSDSDTALEFSHFVTDDLAKAGSASFGECELFPYIDGAMVVDDMTFLQAASQGQTVFASAGDTGAACAVAPTNGVPGGPPFVNYPASSEYVVAVGGTTLVTNPDYTYNQEIAWYAGGGGISQFEGAPYWQTAAGVPSSNDNARGVPDIAMDADPYSGANVYVDGVVEQVGGTSLSSPLALGVWARMISLNPKLGFASPRLYHLYDGSSIPPSYLTKGFHDIIVGDNVPYPALPGYDYDTGLGTFDVQQLVYNLVP